MQQLIEKEFGRIPAGTVDAPLTPSSITSGSTSGGEDPSPAPPPPPTSSSNGNASNGNGTAAAAEAVPPAVPAEVAARQLQCHGAPPLPPAVVPAGSTAPSASTGSAADVADAGLEAAGQLLKVRHPVRPPVAHKHGHGPMAPGEGAAAVSVFRHPLLQSFMLSVFCKLPVTSMTTMDDLRKVFMVRGWGVGGLGEGGGVHAWGGGGGRGFSYGGWHDECGMTNVTTIGDVRWW